MTLKQSGEFHLSKNDEMVKNMHDAATAIDRVFELFQEDQPVADIHELALHIQDKINFMMSQTIYENLCKEGQNDSQ